MKSQFTRLMLACTFITGAALSPLPASALVAQPTKGVVRVKLQPEMAKKIGARNIVPASGTVATGITPFDASASRIKARSVKRLIPYNAKFEAKRAKYGLDRWYEITFDESVDPAAALQVLKGTPGIQEVSLVRPMKLVGGNEARVLSKNAITKATQAMPFNDPLLPRQWHYSNDGSLSNSVAGADANIFEAWKQTTGRKEVVVAIIDGGIDLNHEDLKANLWSNPAEAGGLDGVDDDGDGYVDDIHGWNFCTNSAVIYPHDHGTHVAGTVGAVNNNGLGVAGVAGGDGTSGSGVKLMSCQVFDSRSGSKDGDFAAALVYAAEHGADIAQCSWGWGDEGYYEQPVLDAVDYFTNEATGKNLQGGLCIFASGNFGLSGPCYPAAHPSAVAVAAMTAELRPASYSNHGSYIDITAPGGDVTYGEIFGVLSTLPDNNYGYMDGTSMATPHVSGIAALILSKYGSPTLPSSTLRTQLTTSVNDFYTRNPEVRGLYGEGYIDAAKALNMGSGAAPSAVSQFTLLPSQDEITVDWTIPAAEDNNVNHHVIYWSTEPFTAQTDLSALPHATVDTKFASSGDKFSYSITPLKPLTTYYIAMTAVNRWGDASALSEVKSATTNAGPKMTLATQSVEFTTSPSAPGKGIFTIGNDEAGILRWSLAPRYTAPSLWNASRPAVASTSKARASGPKAFSAPVVAISDYIASDFPKSLTYSKEIFAFIGEEGKADSDSEAQWFRVAADEFADGFNLTHVKIGGFSNNNPTPKIQIFKGNAMAPDNLVIEWTPDFFAYDYNIALPEQIYIAPGESFWIAVHFTKEKGDHPLGMGMADSEMYASYSMMSTDFGKSWVTLAEALKGSPYESVAAKATWHITAISQNPDWCAALGFDPSEGSIRKGEIQQVTVSADKAPLINGKYSFTVKFKTNESDANTLSLPVTVTVEGNKPVLKAEKIVEFGSLLVGQKKELTVEVFNSGYGSFGGINEWTGATNIWGEDISCSSEHFSGPDYISGGFQARAATRFTVTYSPKSEGSHTGAITFTDSTTGAKFTVTVHGVASEPAHIAVEPTTINAGELDVTADAVSKTFTISNTGKYPLEFTMPRFSDEQIEGITGGVHKYGYTIDTSTGTNPTFSYSPCPALIGATDISSQFSDANCWSKPIDPGFEFPFYGKNYSKIYVSSQGAVAFGTTENIPWDPVSERTDDFKGLGYISAYGRTLNFSPDSRIEYAKADGKLVVNFHNVLGLVYGSDFTPISFHISLAPNGDIEIFYDNYEAGMLMNEGRSTFLGILDPDMEDPLVFTSAETADSKWTETTTAKGQLFRQVCTGAAFKFTAPKPWFVTSVEPATGLIAPGESLEVTASLKADATMNAGPSFNNLVVLCNDPDQPSATVHFDAEITGDALVAVASLATESLDFGKVMRTAEATRPLTVRNTGHRAFTIDAVSLAGTAFTVGNLELPATVEPGMPKDIPVILPTATEGAVSDEITVSTSAGTLKAGIKGEVIGVPVITLGYEAIDKTVEYGEAAPVPLTIANEGNETLRYAINPCGLVAVPPVTDPSALTEYITSSSQDGDAVKFEWVDIVSDGSATQHNYTYYMSHDFVEVELPFAFPFYGKTYSKMYVYNTGFVSFTPREDQHLWPEPPADFPQGTLFTNIIAPYWGMHSMDTNSSAGTYFKVEADRAVVSWMEYGNSMNYGVCYQLILNSDGTFRFQYKGKDGDAVIFAPFGLAGISNEDASQSIRLADRHIKFNTAMQFSPVTTIGLEPGESATVGLSLRTDRMGGTYTDVLTVNTNVPTRAKIEIPVNLTVIGTPDPVLPEMEPTVQHTVGYMDYSEDKPYMSFGIPYGFDFAVANNGTAPFVIEGVTIGNGDNGIGGMDPLSGDVDDDMGNGGDDTDWSQYFTGLLVYGEMMDWMTGETTVGWGMYEGTPITVGKEPVRFALPMPYELALMPGTYQVPVTLQLAGLDPSATIPYPMFVTFVVTPAPVLAVNPVEEVRVTGAEDGKVYSEEVTLANGAEDALAVLTYSAYLDPTGQGEELPGGGGGVAPMLTSAKLSAQAQEAARKRIIEFAKSGSILDTPQDFEYNEALYYPANQSSTAAYNYGSGNTYAEYKAATAFKAPAGGFNISHVYNVATRITSDYDFTIEIIRGNDPAGTQVIGRASATVKADPDYNPSLLKSSAMTIPLDKPVYINEGEEFYVVATYPGGNPYPSVLVSKEDDVTSGRYMGWTDEDGWFDVASVFSDTYGSLGYIMACLETQEGQPWVTVDGAKDGEVKPGSAGQVKLRFTPETAPLDRGNMMMLVIKTNSPDQPIVNIPVYLDKNGAPVIGTPESTVYAKEGMTTELSFTVTELDGEDFSVEISDESDAAAITAIDCEGATVAFEGTKASVSGSNGSEATFTVTLSPDFGTLGAKRLNVFASDAAGHTASAVIGYVVEHTNRAPVADSEFIQVTLSKGSTSNVVNFGDIFSDPDGDDLTFEFSLPHENTAQPFASGNGVIFFGKETGTVRASLKATDPSGASAVHEFDVTVTDAMGIEGITVTDGITVAPNPVVTTVDVTTDFSASDVSYKVYNTAGALVFSHTADAAEGRPVTLDLSQLARGIYFLKVNDTPVTLIKK